MGIACISPLLTYAKLWQIKEWRTDRLKEHLRAEGWLRQLFGIKRPALVGIAALIALPGIVSHIVVADITLVLLGLLSLTQVVVRMQKYPVWTSKAILVVVGALLLSMVAVGAASVVLLPPPGWIHIAIVLLQPLAIAIVWTLLKPIDHFLKNRIINNATNLLASFEHTTVIGITGSVGKTTTKELIYHALQGKEVLCTPAYVNSDMGVAQWLLRVLKGHKRSEELILIVEMGAYKKGEIERLCGMCQPQIGIITFIGIQHLALFGSQEKLAAAKAELLESLPSDGQAFLNADCEACLTVKDKADCPVSLIGTAGNVDIEAFDIEEHAEGISFRTTDTAFSIPLHGTHNVSNALLMIGACKALGMTENDIAARMRNFVPPSSTFDVRQEHSVTVLDDTHNASPESFRAAIAWAGAHPATHKTLITPGLIELGHRDTRIHRDLGALATSVFDRVIFTGKNGQEAFAEGFKKPVEMYQNPISTIPGGSLLVCIGRISKKHMQNLIP